MLNYSQNVFSNSDYVFAYSVMQKVNHKGQINIATRKVAPSKSTTGTLTKSFKKKIKDFIAGDQIFNFRNSIKGNSTFCKSFS